MPNPGTIIGQITEELGELGKQVGRESAKVPKDIAGKALESLGGSSGKKTQSGATIAGSADTAKGAEKTPLDQFAETADEKIKKAIARAALEEIAGIYKKKQREPSVWEKIQMEAEQKKQLAAQQKQQTAKMQLPKFGSKRPRGDPYAIKAKRAGTEMSRNVRQD